MSDDLGGSWAEYECPDVPSNDRCVAALGSGWLVAGDVGLVEIGDSGVRRVRGRVELQPKGSRERLALHTSADGRFAGVVVDYGDTGVVVDLSTGLTTLEVGRGDYCSGVTPFPFGFVGAGEDTAVVAASRWNRLDVYDAGSGRLLTGREFDDDNELDYFHGALAVSPSGRWVLVDGWVWQPAAAQVVIDLAAWRAGAVYAAEADAGVGYPDNWDRPVAWVDNDTVAVQGYGGTRAVEIPSGRVKWTIDGAEGPLWSDGALLYAAAPGGLQVWSTETRERVGVLAGYRPVARNPATGAFAEFRDGALRCWRP
ncbi:hypothetical protein JOD54_005174 [Actinokineospora baliensis]|uniref:hypothetical protein n=1 Tax=Actinokineospora baliensis TaxID=547056 RepID=UPI00195A33E0|nr:hypothetical protein [Actinokineospora baliensis]MBM7774970.1 hypothetical protein [Actinokineospora baliensis]